MQKLQEEKKVLFLNTVHVYDQNICMIVDTLIPTPV